jgi:formate dehydrogenase subunit gamma
MSGERGVTAPRIARFSAAERIVHRTTATLMLGCIGTAGVLYNGSLSLAIGHRHVVELIHVYLGFALPVPMIAGVLSAAYRADLTRLNRWSKVDRLWLRRRTRAAVARQVAKFNPGQKINSWLSAGAILVLFGTGQLMYFTGLAPLAWRTGATFVHDWAALAVGLLVAGHTYRALRDSEARHGMRVGTVSADWARENHPAWAGAEGTGPLTPDPS